MCGICGKVDFDRLKIEEPLLRQMNRVLSHRGPDDEGIYLSEHIGLGHRRLSIIDLKRGHQPMSNEDGTLWIVFNGEIYNFQELRERLIAKGYSFKTTSDTETLLYLYEEKGFNCITELRGMFAFAIWDARRRRLFLARDRVGKKPLYYFHDGKRFLFGSEIKAILEDDSVPREVNEEVLHHYLTFGYSLSPQTMFKGIYKLPPAHFLVVEANGIQMQSYWSLHYEEKWKGSLLELEERLLEELKEAVRIRLISEVPLGAFLSGGVDSSIVVALMSQICRTPVKTFTIGFEDEDYNEIRYARQVAEYLHTEHHEFVVKPETMKVLPRLIWHYNEPFGDSSCIPTYYLAKLAREYVTVALNGDGGDESFAGYDRYKAGNLSVWLDRFPRPVLLAGSKAAALLDRWSFGRRGRYAKAKNFLETLCRYSSLWERYSRWVNYFEEDEKEALYEEGFKRRINGNLSSELFRHRIRSEKPLGIVDQLMRLDTMTYLPEDLLVKMDVATMAHALEARSPLLDHKVMEFAARLPEQMKLRNWTSKYILKRMGRRFLPKEIFVRPKMGFGVPIGRWFRKELKSVLREILLDPKSLRRGYFKKETLTLLLEEHLQGKRDHSFKLWALLNLELWHGMFIDKKPEPVVAAECQ